MSEARELASVPGVAKVRLALTDRLIHDAIPVDRLNGVLMTSLADGFRQPGHRQENFFVVAFGKLKSGEGQHLKPRARGLQPPPIISPPAKFAMRPNGESMCVTVPDNPSRNAPRVGNRVARARKHP